MKVDTSHPFLDGDLAFMLWLSRQEWQFLYAWTFAEEMVNGRPWPSLGAAFRAGIAEMEREHGFQWSGVRHDRAGRLWPLQEEPVEEGNSNWIAMLKSDMAPDYPIHLRVAIRFAEERLPDLDTEPIKEALHRTEGAAREAGERLANDPELRREIEERFAEGLERIGGTN